jgi:hypothetical protein
MRIDKALRVDPFRSSLSKFEINLMPRGMRGLCVAVMVMVTMMMVMGRGKGRTGNDD